MVQTSSKLTPAQRSMLFDQATRQNRQIGETITLVENSSKSIVLPKARFLSRVFLMVKGTYKAKHNSKTSFTKSYFDKYNLLRNIRLSINNGFNPYQISGPMMKLYNDISKFKSVTDDTKNVVDYMTNTVSSSGASNTVAFMLDLSTAVNQRDTIGLINLQHGSTQVELTLDFASVAKMMTDTDVEISDVSISVTPVIETYSVPPIADAIPDYSVIKIVNEQRENIVANGETTVKLPVGLTYRKIMLYMASDTGLTPITADKVDSFQLAFNTADIPYNVPADFVSGLNCLEYGKSLPVGAYSFDFSDNGIVNFSGGRDYIDTEKLTQFDLKIRFKELTGNTNYIYVVAEKLAQL